MPFRFPQDLDLDLKPQLQVDDGLLLEVTAKVGTIVLDGGGSVLGDLLHPAVKARRMKAEFSESLETGTFSTKC